MHDPNTSMEMSEDKSREEGEWEEEGGSEERKNTEGEVQLLSGREGKRKRTDLLAWAQASKQTRGEEFIKAIRNFRPPPGATEEEAEIQRLKNIQQAKRKHREASRPEHPRNKQPTDDRPTARQLNISNRRSDQLLANIEKMKRIKEAQEEGIVSAQVGGLSVALRRFVDDSLDEEIPVVAICKTPITNMSDFQLLIEKHLNDFDEDGGSTIEPHKQCATLIFNTHAEADKIRTELRQANGYGKVVDGVRKITRRTLVGRERPLAIIMDGTGLELSNIMQECKDLGTPYKHIDTTITGGYIIEFWTMKHLDAFLLKRYIYDGQKKPHRKLISIYGRADQNRWIGGLTELPANVISEVLLQAHQVRCTVRLIRDPKDKRFKGCAHILCHSLEDALRLDERKNMICLGGNTMCKVDVINKKRVDAPPEEQPVPHVQP